MGNMALHNYITSINKSVVLDCRLSHVRILQVAGLFIAFSHSSENNYIYHFDGGL